MSGGVVCKSGDIVLCQREEYSQSSEEDITGRPCFGDDGLTESTKHSPGCVLPGDSCLVEPTEETQRSDTYLIRSLEESQGCVFPDDTFLVESTEETQRSDTYLIPSIEESQGCVFPGDKYLVEATEETQDSDKYLIRSVEESQGCVFLDKTFLVEATEETQDSDTYLIRSVEESQGCVFPGDKFLVEATEETQKRVFPCMSYLVESTNESQGSDTYLTRSLEESQVCSFPGDKYILKSSDDNVLGSEFNYLWEESTNDADDFESESHLWVDTFSSDCCSQRKDSINLWLDNTESTDSCSNRDHQVSAEDRRSTDSNCNENHKTHLWIDDKKSKESKEMLKLQLWSDDSDSSDSCYNGRQQSHMLVDTTRSTESYCNEVQKLQLWVDEQGSTDSCSIGNYKHSPVWMSCDSIRCFTDDAFTYCDDLEDLREDDQSLFTSDDASMTSPRSYESDCENNTIGRFATRRLSQTLLNIGISQDELKKAFPNPDPSVKMTKHLKTYVTRDAMQSFVTGMVVVEVNSKPVVVVADQINQCVKSFYIDSKQRDHDFLHLCNWPSSITTLKCCKEPLVAVNIPFPHHIDIIRISPRLQIVHKIKMPKEYFCLASLGKNKMVASSVWEDPPTVDILYIDWKEPVTVTVMRSIVIKKSFLSLCNDPFYLNTNSQRDILLIDWETNGFVCMNQSGTLKFKYVSNNIDQTMQPHSVTCDSRDNIYISDAEQNRVVQLTRHGEFLRDVLTVEHGLDEPRHVAIDCHGSMYVSQFNGDIKVFSFDPPLVSKRQTLLERMKTCFSK